MARDAAGLHDAMGPRFEDRWAPRLWLRRHPISVAGAALTPYPGGYLNGAKHWFNHLSISPDGSRFIYLHRWRGDQDGKSFIGLHLARPESHDGLGTVPVEGRQVLSVQG